MIARLPIAAPLHFENYVGSKTLEKAIFFFTYKVLAVIPVGFMSTHPSNDPAQSIFGFLEPFAIHMTKL